MRVWKSSRAASKPAPPGPYSHSTARACEHASMPATAVPRRHFLPCSAAHRRPAVQAGRVPATAHNTCSAQGFERREQLQSESTHSFQRSAIVVVTVLGSLNAEHMNKPEAAPRFAAARAAVACTPLTGKSAGVRPPEPSSATAMLICIRSASCAFENVLELTADRLCWRKALVRAQIVLLSRVDVIRDAGMRPVLRHTIG